MTTTETTSNPLAPLVLVVDDEPQIRRFLRAGFELQDFRVIEAATAKEAIDMAVMRSPDLVVLDLGLPDADGSKVLETLRSWSSNAIIVLSVRDDETEKVRLFEHGADDYVVKPFGMAELLARARVVLRRIALRTAPEPVIRVGALSLDFAQRLVGLNGAAVALSPKEFALLRALAAHHGKVLTHQAADEGDLAALAGRGCPVSAHPDEEAARQDRARSGAPDLSRDGACGRLSPPHAGAIRGRWLCRGYAIAHTRIWNR